MIPDALKNLGRRIVDPITNAFIAMKVTANVMTFIGLMLSIISGLFYALGHFIFGSIVLIIAGISDTFDGQIARKTNTVSKFGAFFDSTIDRFNEFAVLTGIMYFYLSNNYSIIYVFAVLFAIMFSIMISYIRARAEGLGINIKRGLMTRVERVLFIIIISFLPLKIFNYMILLFVLLNFITVIERMIRVKKHT